MPSTGSEWTYWIVQPLLEGFGPMVGRGFTVYFRPYPMGRDEYNYPDQSLRKLHEAAGGTPVVEPHQVTAGGTSRTVYFLGPARDLAPRAREMELWLSAGGETKIPCQFAEAFYASLADIERLIQGQQRLDAAGAEWGREWWAWALSESAEPPGAAPDSPRIEIAWWAMQYGFMFTFDPTVAANLLKAIELEATTHEAFGQSEWD